MKVMCKYTDCDKGNEIDTDKDAYFFIGTGDYKSFAHYTCDRKHSKMMIPLNTNQVKGLQELVRRYYDLNNDAEVPIHILDAYNVLGKYV